MSSTSVNSHNWAQAERFVEQDVVCQMECDVDGDSVDLGRAG
jgi:hypothetical protein